MRPAKGTGAVRKSARNSPSAANRDPAKGPKDAAKPSRIPLYQNISSDLRTRIQQGEWAPAELLPSEEALATGYSVTRMTIRQALSQLAASGLIERRHGVGTLVAEPKLERQTSNEPIGLAEELEFRGLSASSHVLQLKEIRPPSAVRHALWLGTGAKAVLLRRLRYASGILIGLQETYVPARLAPSLLSENMENRSLSKYLRDDCGLLATYAEVTLEAMAATDMLAADLLVAVGSPLLVSSRTSYLTSGRPLEQTTGWFLASRYSYRVTQGNASAPSDS